MLNEIRKTIEELQKEQPEIFGRKVAYGKIKEQDVPDEWNYITFNRVQIKKSGSSMRDYNLYYQINMIHEDYIPEDGTILAKTTYKGTTDNTVFDALNTLCRNNDIQLEFSYTPLYASYYIEGINYLYEFDGGPQSGWMYKVNNWFPNYGCSSYYLKDGDTIVWCYTCEGLGTDVGADEWMG